MKLSRWENFKVNLAVKWMIFKEWLHRPLCYFRGHHDPTLLADNETIYCETCGKVLGNIRRKEYKAEFINEQLEKAKEEIVVAAVVPADKAVKETLEKVKDKIRKRETLKPYVTHRTAEQLQVEHLKRKEEEARKFFLPKSTTRRRIQSKTENIPAARHHKRIARLMHGRGGRKHRGYRRSIKAQVPVEEEENN